MEALDPTLKGLADLADVETLRQKVFGSEITLRPSGERTTPLKEFVLGPALSRNIGCRRTFALTDAEIDQLFEDIFTEPEAPTFVSVLPRKEGTNGP